MSRLTENLKRLEEMGKLNRYHMGIIEDSLKEYEKEVRNKAIDDFAERLNKKIGDFVLEHKDNLDFASGISVAWNMVDEIAEQLKGE